jgi:hypothetical protein
LFTTSQRVSDLFPEQGFVVLKTKKKKKKIQGSGFRV